MDNYQGFRFEKELQKFKGKNRLERLRSYYFTWKLPKNPNDQRLYNLILCLVVIRAKLGFGHYIIEDIASYNVIDLQNKLNALREVGLIQEDVDIIGHCLAHCEILKEIKNEMRN